MNAARFVITLLVTLSVLTCFTPGHLGFSGFLSAPRSAYGEESWKREFDEVCGNTEDAMKLTQEELKNLIIRCDKLKPAIDALEESPRKVYLKRLNMCRSLLAFVLESKEKK